MGVTSDRPERGRAAGTGIFRERRPPGRALEALAVALALLWTAPPAVAQGAGGDDGSATDVGGGVYLYHYAPVDLPGVDDETEIYAAFLDVDHRSGPWSFHGEARWRDTKLRDFYPSTIWVQEAWAAYRPPLGAAPELTLRAGKVYTRLGRFWDGSFFGNLHYFDGLKLDPEFGVEAVLDVPAAGALVEARAQYLLNDDRVNGALVGRDLEGIASGNEAGGAVGGLHVSLPVLGPPAGAGRSAGDRIRVRAGVSGMIERGSVGTDAGGPDQPLAEVTLDHLAADAEITAWGHEAYVEYTERRADGVPPTTAAGPAGSEADYWLAGVQLHFGALHLRYNYSRADYRTAGVHERIHQPGVTVDLASWLHGIVEYDDWSRSSGSGEGVRLDRSLNLVILAEL